MTKDFNKSLTLEATSFCRISSSPGFMNSEILSLAWNLFFWSLIRSLIISETNLLLIWSSRFFLRLSLGNVEVIEWLSENSLQT